MRAELSACGAPESVVDDAVLVLSELLSNACRHARPLSPGESVRAAWSRDAEGELTISVTDGGGPTRPLPATPSVTARGGRGLAIITSLAREWGVNDFAHPDRTDDGSGGVTVWAVLAPEPEAAPMASVVPVGPVGSVVPEANGFAPGLDLAEFDELR